MGMSSGKIEWNEVAVPREQGLFLVVLLIIVYGLNTYVWGPQCDATKGVRKDIDAMSAQVKIMEQTLAKLQEVKAAPVVEAPVETAAPSLADPRFAPYLRGDIKRREDIQRDVVHSLTSPDTLRGLTLQDMVFDDHPIDQGHYVRVPFRLAVKGPFNATLHYLQQIELLPILVVFDDIVVISPIKDRSQLETTLSASMYVVKSADAFFAPGGTP